MNWWPWQPKQAPVRTASETACKDHSGCGVSLPHGTYGGMNHADLDQYLLGQAQAEHLRKPGPGDIEFYRNRARSAEAEAKKHREENALYREYLQFALDHARIAQGGGECGERALRVMIGDIADLLDENPK